MENRDLQVAQRRTRGRPGSVQFATLPFHHPAFLLSENHLPRTRIPCVRLARGEVAELDRLARR